MTIFRRIRTFLSGLLMMIAAVLFVIIPGDDKYMIIIGIIAVGLAFKALNDIIFYFVMARHMVGGKMILFQGVVVLDFAILAASMSHVPKIYILLYLAGIHAFSGVVETLRAMEARRTVEGPWRMKLGHGIVNFLLALACIIFIRRIDTAVLIYSLGLIYSAVIRMIGAFRRTTFIVIE
ncbi:MAG: hypothetical protein K6G67_00265 [Lachnospiraceae bacterium]|nr:hypothetical protein [Lachnospiraceae bacterium]